MGAVSTYRASDPGGGTITWSLPNTSFETDLSDFTINSRGELSFNSSPNHESPHDSNRDNVYKVTVRASDASGGTDDRDVAITVTNRNPTIDPGQSSVSYAEGGRGSVATYTASDPGGGTITWSLPNTSFETDLSDFTINSRGELSFNSSPNHESPHDSNRDNVYKVTVRASDASGGTDDRDVAITVTNRNPTIDPGQSSVSYAEGGRGSVATYTASDPGGGTITWSLPNTSFETDLSDFTINSRGVLSFNRSPNYESPHDYNGDNVYKVTVRASDASGDADDRDVTITVTNEDPTIAPGSSSVSYAEGGRGSVATYTASDPGGGNITWSLPNTSFETDLSDFTISGGVLSFRSSPDYENPHDFSGDNVYKVTVRASDGTLTADRNVTITVTNEKPTITGRSSVSYAEGGRGSVATYTASDPGGGTITWSLPNTSFETDLSDFTINNGVLSFRSSPNHESPHDSNQDNVYKVTVRASDGTLTDNRDVTITVTNEKPTIAPGQSSVRYAEGGRGSVATYTASDPGGGTITWSLPNTSFETDLSDFTISGGVLSFRSSPNHESPHDSNQDNVYKVTVRASDGVLTAERDVTIRVVNVNEPPVVDSEITDRTLLEGSSETIDLSDTFSDPDGDILVYIVRSSDTGVATASVSDSMLTIAASSAGSATITVEAADRPPAHVDRLTVADRFTVTVEPSAPAKVAVLTAMPGSSRGTIDLDWDPADGADSYEVAQWRQRIPLIPILYHWVILDDTEVTIDLSNTSAVVTGLVGGNTYRHRVRGVRGTGSDRVEGPWSDHVDTTLTLPDKVQGLTGTPGQNHGEISLSWDAADGATGYQVRQRKRRFLLDTWIELPGEGFGVAINGTNAVVSNLDSDETYVYQVRGTNVHGEGEWSDSSSEISVRDESPDTPTDLRVVQMIGGRGLLVSWEAGTGAADYEVETSYAGGTSPFIATGLAVESTRLIPGTAYSFRVRSRKPHDGSHLFSDWTDAVTVSAPTPTNVGHQKDHTVAYVVGSITAAPGLPAGVPDPVMIIPAAINHAVDAWNASTTAIVGKNLKICEVGSCDGANHDRWTVTVKTVHMNTKDTGVLDNTKLDEGCGFSVACVKSLTWGQGNHLGDMSLIIEEPAYECRGPPNSATGGCIPVQHVRVYWTDVIGDAGAPGPTADSEYYYIGATMIHEFGHTFGLPDFGNDATLKGLSAIMDSTENETIMDEDIAQLRAIYAIHDSASH